LPESYLSADACLILLDNISSGLRVHPAIINRRIQSELPFMATENIIMALVEKGVSRQDAHEEIRVLSHEATDNVVEQGGDNDLLDRIRKNKTKFFEPIIDKLDTLLDPNTFVGRAPQQVEEFVSIDVKEALDKYVKAGQLQTDKTADLHV